MKETLLLLIGMTLLPGSLAAQEFTTKHPEQKSGEMPKRPKHVTYEQMTEKMVKELQLDEKQQKKVTKLNKKYKTLIEGEQDESPRGQRPAMGTRPSGRPSGGMGGPGGGDYDKKQKKYDKAIGKILTEQQYEGYLKIKPQFASQRKVREFLLGNQLDLKP